MKKFKIGEFKILISTDMLSRGIDISGVSLVVNYDIPSSTATYIHRIGRSGRYGRKGIALNFVTNNDSDMLEGIESFYSTSITELPQDFEKFF